MAAQEVYEMLVAQGCEDESEDTIKLGTKMLLKMEFKGGEAMDLLIKLILAT